MNENINSALLVMDVQEATVDMINNRTEYLTQIAKAIEAARKDKIPVLYIVVGFRKGYPEISRNNKGFMTLKKRPYTFDNEASVKIPEQITPLQNEMIITKKRVSAFTGSDLDVVLRSLDIRHIILAGIATSGVVLSTLREAADKDYLITVLSDCCADRDDEVHHILITKVFPRQAEVQTLSEWETSLM